MQQFRKRERFIICAFAVLLCLTLVSFWMTSNIYARYTAEATGSDSARVAKFSVTETGVTGENDLTKSFDLAIAPGESKEYRVQVTNESEVAIDYVISAKNKYDNLPLKFSIADVTDGSNTAASSSYSEISGQTAGTIAANDGKTHIYSLTVSWSKDSADQADESYAGMADVLVVTLEAKQKD